MTNSMASIAHRTFVPLPPPLAPSSPDFWICHPFYGINLSPSVCEIAASQLPVGNLPIPLVRSLDKVHLSIVEVYDSCKVTVQWENPDTDIYQGHIYVDSLTIRTTANWLLTSCVMLNGYGGFSTIGLQNTIDWVANETNTNENIADDPWPVQPSFLTITVEDVITPVFDPGFHDPAMAEALSDGIREKGNQNRADMMTLVSRYMQRSSEPTNWWWVFSETHDIYLSEASEMVYTCDGNLGTPNAVDCEMLAYSGLGPSSDTVTIGPGPASKLISFRMCNAMITALATVVLTWAQIQAALNTLVDTCVMHPLLESRGGRAFSGTLPFLKKRNPATGLNALPPHVSILLSDQNLDPNKYVNGTS